MDPLNALYWIHTKQFKIRSLQHLFAVIGAIRLTGTWAHITSETTEMINEQCWSKTHGAVEHCCILQSQANTENTTLQVSSNKVRYLAVQTFQKSLLLVCHGLTSITFYSVLPGILPVYLRFPNFSVLLFCHFITWNLLQPMFHSTLWTSQHYTYVWLSVMSLQNHGMNARPLLVSVFSSVVEKTYRDLLPLVRSNTDAGW